MFFHLLSREALWKYQYAWIVLYDKSSLALPEVTLYHFKGTTLWSERAQKKRVWKRVQGVLDTHPLVRGSSHLQEACLHPPTTPPPQLPLCQTPVPVLNQQSGSDGLGSAWLSLAW